MIGRYHGFEYCYFIYQDKEENRDKVGICYLIKNNEPKKMLKIPRGENIEDAIKVEIDLLLKERSDSIKVIRRKVNNKRK